MSWGFFGEPNYESERNPFSGGYHQIDNNFESAPIFSFKVRRDGQVAPSTPSNEYSRGGVFSGLSGKMMLVMAVLLVAFTLVLLTGKGPQNAVSDGVNTDISGTETRSDLGESTTIGRTGNINLNNSTDGNINTFNASLTVPIEHIGNAKPASTEMNSAGASSLSGPGTTLVSVPTIPIPADAHSSVTESRPKSASGKKSQSKDEYAMCDFADSLGMPKQVTGWKCEEGKALISPCEWSGVVCDDNYRVLSIAMVGASVRGTIPASIDKLSHLRVIDLRDNLIDGTIPPNIAKIHGLEEVYLGDNKLQNGIPPKLGRLQYLRTLSVYNNSLSGKLPRLFDKPPFQIEKIDLSGNKITGGVPQIFGKISTLKSLSLRDNLLRYPSFKYICNTLCIN